MTLGVPITLDEARRRGLHLFGGKPLPETVDELERTKEVVLGKLPGTPYPFEGTVIPAPKGCLAILDDQKDPLEVFYYYIE